MSKKIFFTALLSLFFIITMFSYSLAANNTIDNAKNGVMNVGNAIGNTVVAGKNAVVDGARDLTGGAMTLGNDVANTTQNTKNSTSSVATTTGTDYTAARTSADTNNLVTTVNTWTWIILGIVGVVIIALVWYYGAQYEHKNYDNEQ